MRVLVFRHGPAEDLGNLRPALESLGITVESVDLYAGQAVPDVRSAAGLIFMGGRMCANDNLPYLREELRLIDQAARSAQPVLGVCLGAQLIAKALGVTVYEGTMQEIGWIRVRISDTGLSDPLFSGLGRHRTVFQWHYDTFDLPPGGELLASSDICRNQAFRCGNIYGVQFHPEVTAAMIEDWQKDAAERGEAVGAIDPAPHIAQLEELCGTIVTRWSRMLPNEW